MELGGKKLSQCSKIIACLIVVLVLIINAVSQKTIIPIDDAIKAGIFVFLMFAPIDVSIWLGIFKKSFPHLTDKEKDETAGNT